MPAAFYPFHAISVFVLFFLLIIMDSLAFNYLSFIIGCIGAILFNPVFPLDFSFTTLTYIEKCFAVIVNLWMLHDIDSFIILPVMKPYFWKKISLNSNTDLYEIKDGSFKYELNQDLVKNYSDYMNQSSIGLMEDWLSKLNAEDRKKVKRKSVFI